MRVGKATPFDAEMFALNLGITKACKHIDYRKELHIFANNKRALQRILNSEMRPSQRVAVLACKELRKWLKKDVSNHVFLHWYPSHVGITLNEDVDKLAGEAAKDLPQPPNTSWAYAKQRITSEEINKWRKRILTEKLYRNSSLFGRSNPKMIKQIKYTSDSWFLKQSGGKSWENACLM